MACNWHKPKCGKSEDVCSPSHQRNNNTYIATNLLNFYYLCLYHLIRSDFFYS